MTACVKEVTNDANKSGLSLRDRLSSNCMIDNAGEARIMNSLPILYNCRNATQL